jgi:molecular chaperone GrpE
MEKEQNQKLGDNKPNNDKNLSKDNKPNNDKDLSKDNKKEDSGPGDNKKKVNDLNPEDKIRELEDKITRTFAEMENQRRRFEKEKIDAFEYGGFSFAKEALNLIDNLERSKNSLENDVNLKDTEALKKTLEHFNIIKKDLMSIFEKNSIKPIDALGEKLDPNFHQAMMEIEDDEKEPGTIIQEIQKGFLMKERLLRPSLVGVSKKIVKKEEKDEENQDNQEVK